MNYDDKNWIECREIFEMLIRSLLHVQPPRQVYVRLLFGQPIDFRFYGGQKTLVFNVAIPDHWLELVQRKGLAIIEEERVIVLDAQPVAPPGNAEKAWSIVYVNLRAITDTNNIARPGFLVEFGGQRVHSPVSLEDAYQMAVELFEMALAGIEVNVPF